MTRKALVVSLLAVSAAWAQTDTLAGRAVEFLTALVRLDTSNPPGSETRAARYLKEVADRYGIAAELLGDDPDRLNFVARLPGTGELRPLLLMAHTDVVPADRAQWTVDPFGAEIRGGFLYGRGSLDDKSLLAAEMAVLVEVKRRGLALKRDLILVAEADEESGSSGIQWLIANAREKIDAEAALNETGLIHDLPSGIRLFEIQTAEKVPTRVLLTAHGTAGHASLPRSDNPVVRLARAIVRLEADQPVGLNTTTRRYFAELARLPDYAWLLPLVPRLENPSQQATAAAQIRARDPELDTQLRASVSPTMLQAGIRINVIPNTAQAQIDVRRLPHESRAEILARFRNLINDNAVEVSFAPGSVMPATEPSSITSPVYKAMERALHASSPRAAVVPLMSRGATDGAYLREHGMAVYGVPVFVREEGESRVHGNDERIQISTFEAGAELLMRIVNTAAGE
jgi:acetylornithine deacetylase/succinyl-diaminopimelate desuccinylase-like protein